MFLREIITSSINKSIILSILIIMSIQSCSLNDSNNDKIISINTPESPLVTFRILFNTGSANDPTGKEGLNALTALTVGQGGTSDLTYRGVVEILYPLAASLTLQYDKEVTTFIGEVHRDHLEPFFVLLTEIITNPRLDPDDFQRNKDLLINQIVTNLRGNNDEELGKQALNSLLYEGHPYEYTEMGTEEGLTAVTLEDVRDYYSTWYTQSSITVGIAGGFPENLIGKIGSELIGTLPLGSPTTAVLQEPRALEDIEVLLVEKQVIATAISLGFPVNITRADKDFYALMVANSYLGEHRTFNGRLMNVMRQLRGLNYGDYSYIEHFVQDGGSTFPVPNVPRSRQYFSIWIRPVAHNNAHFALRQALRELQILIDDGMTQEQFEETRDFLLNYSKLYVQTISRRLGYLMDSKFYGSKYHIDRIENELRALSLDNVNRAIRRNLQYSNIAVAIVTPDAATLRDNLLSDSSSPITYSVDIDDDLLSEDKEIMSYPLSINPEHIIIIPVENMFKN